MERLTRRGYNGTAVYATPSGEPVKWENNRHKVLQKLADYEDAEEHGQYGKWIPVSERLPEEHDSIFKKFKGTSKWDPAMFEKISGYVIATVEYMDGTRLTTRAHTTDGIWKADNSLMTGKVVAWMPLPEPYRESEEENGK